MTGATDRVTLTGGVQVSDAGSVLWADKMMMEQQTGDGVAEGSVKASYVQPNSGAQGAAAGSQDVVHVTGGAGGVQAGGGSGDFLWGGGEARLGFGRVGRRWRLRCFSLSRRQRRLVAHGAGQGAPMAVHAVFVNSGAGKTDAGKVDSSSSSKASGGRIGEEWRREGNGGISGGAGG